MNGRRTITALGLAGLVSASSLGLVGCGETTIKTAPEPVTPGDSSNISPGSGTSGGSAAIGNSITLSGYDDGEQIEVTALRVRDPASASNSFMTPDPGNRFLGVRVRLRNTGTVVYDDSPSNGASVVDGDDQGFSASFFDAVEPGLGSPKIRPGDQRVGWITFEVPRSSQLRAFQFTLDSGFGPETGEWRLN